jgi:hypothetical protein
VAAVVEVAEAAGPKEEKFKSQRHSVISSDMVQWSWVSVSDLMGTCHYMKSWRLSPLSVREILLNVFTEQRPSFEEIKDVVENNDKKRY